MWVLGLLLLLGALQAWASRYVISSEDGIAYLDVGDAYWRGDWSHAINAQWSPAYSLVLGLALHVLRPSAYWEFPIVKLVNFLIYLFAFGCFEFFLRRLRRIYLNRMSRFSGNFLEVSEGQWWLLGYPLFFWFALKWITVSSDTPDMLTAAFVFLAVGILLNLESSKRQYLDFAVLGLCLGLSYLSKTVMFPLSLVFLAVGLFSVANFRRGLPRTLVALLVFGLVTAPFVVAISLNKGRLTYGETGKLNYAWLINPGSYVIQDHHWQGGPPGNGTPIHPTRQIFDSPAAFEFAGPVGGTYPPWYDPSYWYDGLTIKFDLLRQLRMLVFNGAFYFLHLGAAIFCYLVLIALGGRFLSSLRELRASWILLVPALSGLGLYMIGSDLLLTFISSQPSTRLIAVFAVLLFAAAFASVRLPNTKDARKLVAGLTLATIVVMGGLLGIDAFREVADGLASKPVNWEIAEGLGLQPAAKVAHLGLREYYWARLARLKIVAEIPDSEAFWTTSSAKRSQVLQKIRETGAQVIVQKPGLKIPDQAIDQEGWREIGKTGAYAYRF
jgi:hypothetical protein